MLTDVGATGFSPPCVISNRVSLQELHRQEEPTACLQVKGPTLVLPSQPGPNHAISPSTSSPLPATELGRKLQCRCVLVEIMKPEQRALSQLCSTLALPRNGRGHHSDPGSFSPSTRKSPER